MRHVISASTDGTLVPRVVEIKGQRRMGTNRGLQAHRRLPCAVSNTGHRLALGARGMHGQASPVHGQGKAFSDEPLRLDLNTLKRAVHIADSPAAARLFTQHMPGFQCGTDFHPHITLGKVSDAGETELKLRREPFHLKGIPSLAQVADDLAEIRLAEMRKHPPVVEVGSPAHQLLGVGLFPEGRDQPAQQQVLGQAHLRMRRHLESPHLHEAQPAGRAFRCEELVDAELRPMRVAAGIDQQVPEQPVHQPRRHRGSVRGRLPIQFAEGDLQLVQRIVAGLVHAGGLAGLTDEKPAEEPAQ